MSDRPGVRAQLLFSPLNAGVAALEEDAGLLSDLYFCRETGRFFTLPTAQISIEPRSSRSAKQFFCPVCPKSALKLSATRMACPSCAWDASQTGVANVSDLLQRDGDPFPWISAEVRRLTRRLSTPDEAAAGLVSEPEVPGVPRTTSMHRLRGRRHSMRHIERRRPEDELSKAESASLCVQRFAERQEEREKRVFASWMPEVETMEETRDGRPPRDVEQCMGEVEIDGLVGLDKRVCATSWWKKELAARRRVPAPRVSVRSPFAGGNEKARKAEQVAPELLIWLADGCEHGGEAGVTIQACNRRALGELTVTVANADSSGESAKIAVAEGNRATLTLSPFSFREQHAMDMLHNELMCPRLAVLDVSFQYASSDGTPADISWLRVYARHAR